MLIGSKPHRAGQRAQAYGEAKFALDTFGEAKPRRRDKSRERAGCGWRLAICIFRAHGAAGRCRYGAAERLIILPCVTQKRVSDDRLQVLGCLGKCRQVPSDRVPVIGVKVSLLLGLVTSCRHREERRPRCKGPSFRQPLLIVDGLGRQ